MGLPWPWHSPESSPSSATHFSFFGVGFCLFRLDPTLIPKSIARASVQDLFRAFEDSI